jgi:aspartate/methionine/tyrosine aminotransferase
MLYRKKEGRVKTVFPIPMFSPVLHASDIFVDPIIIETDSVNQFKITPSEIQNLIEFNEKIDAFYLCLLNNPTSISYNINEVEKNLELLFDHNQDIQIIIDGVYIS